MKESNKCWICGGVADTAEHRVKKSDIIESYGSGPYKGNHALLHIKDSRTRTLQGPDSKLIKFKNNLCAKCNNEETQPFDRAYEKFIHWLSENRDFVLQKRTLPMRSIYGETWEYDARSLLGYFSKSLGCRIDEVGHSVPKDIIKFLKRKEFIQHLEITFSVSEDKVILPKDAHDVGVFGLCHSASGVASEHPSYYSGLIFGWISIEFYYNCLAVDDSDSYWNLSHETVSMGSYYSLSEEQREDLKSRLKVEP